MNCLLCTKFSLKSYRFCFNEKFKCPICLKNYNLINNIVPCNTEVYIFIDCGHVVCYKCVDNIKEKIRIIKNDTKITVLKAPLLLPTAFPKDINIPYLMLPSLIIDL